MGQERRTKVALYLLTVATVVFRSELALLLGAHCLWLLRRARSVDAVKGIMRRVYVPGIVPGFLLALVLTVATDTYFWQSERLIWPEFVAFMSNVFPKAGEQGASAWGTQPFYWYLLAALPRLLMAQMLMVDFFFLYPSTWQDPRVMDSLFPSYIYMALYSILPHKETRFMFPIVPSLTLVGAITCTRLTINAHKSAVTKILFYAAVSSTVLTACINHTLLLPLSARNYPGAEALQSLHNYYSENWDEISLISTKPEVHVHLTNLALQTGVTRFFEEPAENDMIDHQARILAESTAPYVETREPLILPGDANHPALTINPKIPTASSIAAASPKRHANPKWVYDKTENNTRLLEPLFWDKFDFVVVENPELAIGAWEIADEIKGLGRLRLTPKTEDKCERFGGWDISLFQLGQYLSQVDEADLERSTTTALLHDMYLPPIANALSHLHNVIHDIVVCGRNLPRGVISFWPEVSYDTKLYILQKTGSGTKPTKKRSKQPAKEDTLGLPEHAYTGQTPQSFERLGPLVVNKDGTLSRLDNWAQMTKQERKKTVEYLKKRNLIRLDAAAI